MVEWLYRHFRFAESIGMLLILSAWGLNWMSVEKWTAVQDQHRRLEDGLIRGYNAGQLTANVRLEAAVSRAVARMQVDAAQVSGWTLYGAAWDSEDVRQAWMARTYNNVLGLRILHGSLDRLARSHNLGNADRLKALKTSLDNAENLLQRSVAPGELGKGFVPAPSQGSLSAGDAEKCEVALAYLAERAFELSADIADAIVLHQSQLSRVYAFAFLIGSGLLMVAKLFEWRKDLRYDTPAADAES